MARCGKEHFNLAALDAVNNASVKSAGERYFPNKCPDFPDMTIDAFDDAVAGLIGGDGFRARVEEITKEIREGWQGVSRRLSDYPEAPPEPDATIRALEALSCTPPGGGDAAIAEVSKQADAAYERTKAISDQLSREWQNADASRGYRDDEPRHLVSRYDSAFWRAMKFLPEEGFDIIRGKLPYMGANACSVYKTGALILHSGWGMGKTHSLCHLTRKQQERGAPVLLALAKDFAPGESPGDALACYTKLAGNFVELLHGLDALGRKAKERALLLVDGINERDGGAWAKGLEDFLRQALGFAYVGVIVSFREPFNPGLSGEILPKLSYLRHPGFEEIAFDVQPQFMKYYGVRATGIPLMAEEFTRPLMLKMMCESFRKLPEKEKRKGFSGIASGQKGMTYLLELYIKDRAKAVAKKHRDLSSRAVWELTKETMARYMAENLTDKMPATLLLKAMREQFSISGMQARKILRDMWKEGVVAVGPKMLRDMPTSQVIDNGKKPRRLTSLQMPYQRFGDHIIARWLLEKYLDTRSARALRRCFYRNRPLGKIFALEDHGGFRSFGDGEGRGITEALILEFPERIKNMPGIRPEEKELLFFLPRWRGKMGAYDDPFFRGLYWRANSSISGQTANLAAYYFRRQAKNIFESERPHFFGNTIETLLSAACRHESPISAAKRLYPGIKQTPMAKRDIVWGAAMRNARSRGWTRNLFSWLRNLEEQEFKDAKPEKARNYIALVALFLGTTDRPLRDEATEALVIIGEKFPAALFTYTLDALDFNDIYYPERMLAACYGVAMSQWQDPAAKEFHKHFSAFARNVAENVFMPGGCLLTHHAVVRDYALGIVDIAGKMGVKFSDKELSYMSRPYPAVPSLFPAPAEIDEATFSEASHAFAISPDFHNRYTVRHISPGGQLADISRQIKWRVMNLGYTDRKFSGTDKMIAQLRYEDSPYGKTDRCGKKYSWIAYHEMCGWLDAKGELSRTIREVDGVLDPSFPIPPPAWKPNFQTLDMAGDDAFWLVKGPAPDYEHLLVSPDGLPGNWVMLDGDITHRRKSENRDVFSLLCGLLVAEADIPRLKECLQNVAHPGSAHIPEGMNDYTIFGGEIPWAKNFIDSHPDWGREMAFGDILAQAIFTHSKGNEARGERFRFSEAWYPVPDICAKLRLMRRGRGVDLFDKDGKTASLYRADAGHISPNPFGDRERDDFQLVYLRKDLLDRYLRIIGKRLVWIVWGQRRVLKLSGHTPEVLAALEDYKGIHKKLFAYNPAKASPVTRVC